MNLKGGQQSVRFPHVSTHQNAWCWKAGFQLIYGKRCPAGAEWRQALPLSSCPLPKSSPHYAIILHPGRGFAPFWDLSCEESSVVTQINAPLKVRHTRQFLFCPFGVKNMPFWDLVSNSRCWWISYSRTNLSVSRATRGFSSGLWSKEEYPLFGTTNLEETAGRNV